MLEPPCSLGPLYSGLRNLSFTVNCLGTGLPSGWRIIEKRREAFLFTFLFGYGVFPLYRQNLGLRKTVAHYQKEKIVVYIFFRFGYRLETKISAKNICLFSKFLGPLYKGPSVQLDLTENNTKYIFECFGALGNGFKPNLTWKSWTTTFIWPK